MRDYGGLPLAKTHRSSTGNATENSMTDRMALLARAVMPWRLLVTVALLSLVPGVLLAQDLAGQHVSWPPSSARAASAPREQLAGLPLTAQGPVSTALGAADARYRVGRAADGSLQALNPAQGLRVDFQPTHVLLSAGATQLALSLRGVGFGHSLGDVGAARPKPQANRVMYARSGLSEWYANGPLGLEQGFTIARAPTGPENAPLTLALAISGDAHAALAPGAKSIVFTSRGGPALRYGDLAASDARGRTLHSWLVLQGGQVLLRVDARGARYPLRIDPLAEQDILAGSGQGGEGLLGYSVALSENGATALVGAPLDTGGAWVFVREGSAWKVQEKLAGEPPGSENPEHCGEEVSGEIEEGCGFGRSVALSADGNTALVGAPRAKEGAGYARVFVRNGSSWSTGETLTGAAGTKSHFGKSVALSADGKTALVGAPSGRDTAGLAWVFARENQEGSAWSPGEQLDGGSESSEAHFGLSVALNANGTTALIGAPTAGGTTGSPETATANAGVAWVFTRAEPSSAFNQAVKLTGGAQEVGGGHFGFSVALSDDGDTALIGARTDDEGAGAAWVFTRSSTSVWAQGPKLTVPLSAKGGRVGTFGYSVALSGDGNTALIGSPATSPGSSGAAWLFTDSGSAWSEQQELRAGESETGPGFFGASVALSSDAENALVGAPDDNGSAGAAWPFAVGPSVSSVSPDEGPTSGGTSVEISGTNFQANGLDLVEAVKFGGHTTTNFTVNSSTSITVVTPPSETAAGVVNVTVLANGEQSVENAGSKFTYVVPIKANAESPVVKGVSPDEGPAAGGTTVTIEGSHLEGVTAVQFGSVSAASFQESSASTITAVSPAESPGTVDVTVTTRVGGTSATKSKDEFTFISSLQGAGGSGAGGSGASAITAAGVLGFGPAPSASCAVALRSKNIAVTARTRAAIKLSSTGLAFSGLCRGKLTIKVKVRLKTRKGHKASFAAKTIGTADFSVASGKSVAVTVKLNAAGRALLASHHGRLSAKLVILQVVPGPPKTHSAIVHLALHKSRARKGKPKTNK
jgi:hypothetical protein